MSFKNIEYLFFCGDSDVEEGYQILIVAYDKIIVIMMEENNDIFLEGGNALVYLAKSTQKYSTTFVWGLLFSTYVSYDQFYNPFPLVRICTHLE